MTSETTIVVVEDEAQIAAAVAARLRAEGHRVEVAGSGPDGVALCRAVDPDLVVLDWMLPGFDGIEACRQIQADRPVPVLFLTARGSESDILVGLGIGADDYLTKPFSPRELVARVAAILRRSTRAAGAAGGGGVGGAAAVPAVLVGALAVDVDGRRVTRSGAEVHLTPTEFDLLAALVARPDRAFTRDELLAAVWDWRGGGGSTRTVDSHVAALRRKLGPGAVRTVQRHGYALGDGA
ncbi:Transcriptional regulatory protein CseB [Paraconexibacter sp. AEG42_29]|uniref:Transcriptional regulatory protein CseB n=1 Tax=Paraconexibacter sp. AEG42_29 TaxID=2997339 RepID=A0AAU7AZ22_9ACTN